MGRGSEPLALEVEGTMKSTLGFFWGGELLPLHVHATAASSRRRWRAANILSVGVAPAQWGVCIEHKKKKAKIVEALVN